MEPDEQVEGDGPPEAPPAGVAEPPSTPVDDGAPPGDAPGDAGTAEGASAGEAGPDGSAPVATPPGAELAPPTDGAAEVLVPASPAAADAPAPGPALDGSLLWIVGAAVVALALVLGFVAGRRGAPRAALPEPADLPGVDGRVATPERAPELARPPSLASRIAERMVATRAALAERFDALFGGPVDDGVLDDLEDALLVADVGPTTAAALVGDVRAAFKAGERDAAALRAVLVEAARARLRAVAAPLASPPSEGPLVILVVGVNGSGKTTTIGKLAARHVAAGRTVLLAAGDTYRAAAAEQLGIWAERAGASLVRHAEGGDPGAVVFDALEAALARGVDVVIIDTAGRLQTARPLMEQLSKLLRVIRKKVPDGPHETLLVLDGTMGQNAMSQARSFHEATPLSGVAITKLDGTAKGGVVLAVAAELGLPVKLVGLGEQVDDLRDFDPDAFVDALL
jgi:fused signal recognition particle receptor